MCCVPTGLAQDLVSTLKPKLEGQVLELRTPAPEVQLTYDSAGTLKHPSKHGLRSIDAFLLVKKIKVEGALFSLEGERLAMVWDQNEQRTKLTTTSVPVYVAIDLPNGGATSEADFSSELFKIFVGSQEDNQRECTPEEQQKFAVIANGQVHPKKRKKKEIESVAPSVVCFPGGNRVLRIGKGLKPPKAIKTEDPHYSSAARRAHLQGTNVFMVAIDDKGEMIDALMVRSLEPSLNYQSLVALRDWKFKPAEFEGKPVACTVNVEINYRLY